MIMFLIRAMVINLLLSSTLVLASSEVESRTSLLGSHSLDDASVFALKLREAKPETGGSVTAIIIDTDDASLSTARVKVEISEPGFACLYCLNAPLQDLLDYVELGLDGSSLSKEIRLFHARCPLVFRYASAKGDVGPATSPLEYSKGSGYHTRIAYGPNPQSEMWVSWTSDVNTTTVPTVLAGSEPGKYNYRFEANAPFYDTYLSSDMCGASANHSNILKYLFPGYFANILLTELDPETKYFFVHGSDSHGYSSEATFTTGKAVDRSAAVRLAAFGDMALSGPRGAMGTVARILALHGEGDPSTGAATAAGGIDAILHFGDLAYAEGSTILWDIWHSYIEPVSSRIPYHVSLGNHEVDHTTQPCSQDPSGEAGPDGLGFHPTWGDYGDDSGGEGGVPGFHRFRSPGSGAPGGTPASGNAIYWYSFTVGSVHVLQLDSEHDMTRGSRQYDWIVQDLAGVDHAATPWIVATFHRPMMSPQENTFAVAEGIRASLEPVFVDGAVDLVLAGHVHAYERCCPMVNLTCTPRSAGGITYVTVGTAGATVHNETMRPEAGQWLESWLVEWGFGVVTAVNQTAMRWDFYSNSNGEVLDSAWILK